MRFTLLLITLSALSCQPPTGEDSQSDQHYSLDFERIATAISKRVDLNPGEQVFILMSPGRFDPLIPLLRQEIEKVRAGYLGTISITDVQPEEWTTDFVASALNLDEEQLAEHFRDVDLGLMLPGANSYHAPYAAYQQVLWGGTGRSVHFHWEGAYGLNGEVLEMSARIDSVYQNSLFNTDYAELSRHQSRFENAMRGQTIRVTTPAGTDISFRIGDRPVTRQDGDASAVKMEAARNLIDREIELPAGAVRVAPLEQTVNGSIAFPDAEWGGEMVRNLIMYFENGQITEFEARSGEGAVRRELDNAGEVAHSFREFALGFNPTIAIPEDDPWIPYYGYGAGVVRLSLGDNTELGGAVSGGYVRWNFFTDATVTIGDTIWVDEGNLIR